MLCDTRLGLTLIPHLEFKDVQLAAQETEPEVSTLPELEAFAKTLFQDRPNPVSDASDADIEGRKSRVIACLTQNQLLVVEEEDTRTLSVEGGVAKIAWPYTTESCISTNEVVLQRISSILATQCQL